MQYIGMDIMNDFCELNVGYNLFTMQIIHEQFAFLLYILLKAFVYELKQLLNCSMIKSLIITLSCVSFFPSFQYSYAAIHQNF